MIKNPIIHRYSEDLIIFILDKNRKTQEYFEKIREIYKMRKK